jgi:hypothetical protein
MADQRISELFEISSSGVASNDVLPIVDTNVSQTKKITAKSLAEAGFRIADDSTLSGSKLTATSVTSDKLASNAVTTAKIADSGVTSAKINSGAIGATQLASSGVTTVKIQDGAVTFAKIQDVSTNTLLGRSTAGIGDVESISCTAAGRAVIGASDAAAQRTALGLGNISLATGTWANGATVSGTNTGDQTITLSGDVAGTGTSGIAVTIGAGAINTTKIADGGVTAEKIADNAITGAKMADNSAAIVSTAAPSANGDYIGQQYLDSVTNIEYTWTGEEWRQQAGLTSLVFPSDALFTYSTDLTVANTATVSGVLNTQSAARFFAGPTSGFDATPTFRAIATTDLPVATNSALGVARPGSGLTINANGIIDHSNSTTSGDYYKVTVDANGHVTNGNTVLIAEDIPALDASKITTGTFGTAFIGNDSIDGTKIGDRVVCNFGETRPAAGDFVGQFFYDPINKDTYVWDSNVWQEISVTAGAIVLAGLYNAGTNRIISLTGAGAAVSGFTLSGVIPSASSGNSGYYFLVNASGVGSGNAPNVTLIPPDIIISDGSRWYEVDVSSSYVSQNASSIAFTPSGDVGATTVQAAILEVSSECRNATNISSGTLAIARGGTGINSYTKGDLLVGSGTTLVKLPVGTNTHVLVADSTTGPGVKWVAATNGTVTTVSGVSPLSVSNPTTTPTISVAAASTAAAGVVQLTNSVSTTSSGIAATATAVKTAYDLANTALQRTGGTMTGSVTIASGTTNGVVFQGTSFNTTLNTVNPSATRSISLPDAGGTIVTSSGVAVVSNAMIASGITVGKLANGTARQLLQTNSTGNGVEWTSNISVAGTLNATGSAVFGSTVTASGAMTATSFNATGATVPANGMYLAASSLRFATNSVQSLSIDPAGTLAVGQSGTNDAQIILGANTTGNRASYIDIIGDTTYTDFGLRLLRGNAGTNAESALIHRGNGDLVIKTQDAGPILFQANSLDAARFLSDGKFLIGYTSDVGGGYKLQVNSQIFATSATIATSDGRYKEDVTPLDNCLDLVKALRPVSFTWKKQENIARINKEGKEEIIREAHNFPAGTQVGFIAQEVQEALNSKPWLGSIVKENKRAAIKDASGIQLAPEETFLGIAEGNLIAVLTNALQETITKVETLEAKLAILEAKGEA